MAVAGCVRAFPQRVDDDDLGAHVYAVGPVAPGAAGEALEPAREALPSAGLTLAAEWGDDRGRYDAHRLRGPALPGGRHVLWNTTSWLVVDTATGAPLQRAYWPAAPPGVTLQRVAVDPAGRRIAAIDNHGAVTLGGLDGADLAPLAVAPRAAPAPVTAPAVEPPPSRYDSVTTEPWGGGEVDGRGLPERVTRRLFFSPDGARLVGGESVWDVATRRPLLALARGEALLGVDAGVTRAAVARLAVRTEVGSPGSQCGYIPVSRSLTVAAAESRDLLGDADPQSLPAVSLEAAVPGFDEPAVEAPARVDALPVDHVALAADGDLAVAQRQRAWWVGRRDARALAWPRDPRSVAALVFTAQGLAAQAVFDAGSRGVQATSLYGRGGSTRRALVGAMEFAPNRAGLMVVRDDGWSVWDVHRMERARGLPDPGRLNLSASDQALLSESGAAVLRDERDGAHVFLVAAGDGWRRVAVPADGSSMWRWTLAPDGAHVAMHESHRLRVVDLRDGRVRWRRAFPGEATASVFAGDRVYVADDRGRVGAFSLDGAELGHADLSARFDHATALAASPDGAALAVGTARSRVFVFRVAP